MPASTATLMLPLSAVSHDMLAEVGGKNASLGDMLTQLSSTGVAIPDGFVLTVASYRLHLETAGVADEMQRLLAGLDTGDVQALATAGARLRDLVASAPLPEAVAAQARAAYEALSQRYGERETDVAVRSSATAEDLPEASFAGQLESYLNVRGWDALQRAIRLCMASLFTDRALAYRAERGIEHAAVGLSVGIQKMVRSDLGAAGVAFTLDPESGFRDVILVTGSWGLGELVVQGRVNPDEFWVHKTTLAQGHRPLLRRELGTKLRKLVYAGAAGDSASRPGPAAVREVRVPRAERSRYVLDDDEVLQLARWAAAIEQHFSRLAGQPVPMDIEWAKDGRTGQLFILQARPETVHARSGPAMFEIFKLRGHADVLVQGRSVGNRVGSGPVRVIHGTQDLAAVQPGDVLVAEMTDPDWEPVLRRAAAVVTDQGGRTCHAAIVSRELGIPCVVGTGDATRVLTEGRPVTVSCAQGAVGRVYDGSVPFTRESIDPARVPESPVPLMVNLANPDLAWSVAQLPSAGVGLLRIEFLVSHWVGIHPMALVHPERVTDATQRARIRARTAEWAHPADFFVDRMASGVGIIAAAFHPRPVIVRFSDFKTNEYASLLGGRSFEPVEANPMIGFRGASRYYDERYREGFALECRAVRKVREEMGLTNVCVMIPFCRTITEGGRVLDEMEKNGLRRGQDGLAVWVMCEVPNNVILAEEFSEIFDGFSIGSNDLTQLTLGVDRDSQQLAHLFDERDPGVKAMISLVVAQAHRMGRPVSLCGQAPSDHPGFAEWLASIEIDSMSLTPDALPGVATRLAERERHLPRRTPELS